MVSLSNHDAVSTPASAFPVVALYGPWFGRPAKAPVSELPERLQGRFDLNEMYISSGFYLPPQRPNFVTP